MTELIDKIKKRWGIETLGELFLILFIFAITGMTALYVRKLAFGWLGFTADTAFWAEVLVWILFVLPAYQILFLFYGFIFGQFEFVWDFEKKSLHRIKRLFLRKGH